MILEGLEEVPTLHIPSEPQPLLVIVIGATGSGKSALSLTLARQFHGEILSCDSVAVYRGMEVGTAKPSITERAEIPHHLLNLLDPTETMTAGDWARAARVTAQDVVSHGRLPILQGGTGLYLRAFTEGLTPLPPRCPSLRARLLASAQSRQPGYLHRLLQRLDAPAAGRIHPNDESKLIRAIEIVFGGTAAGAQQAALEGFRLLRIGLNPPRAALYERLNFRAAAMFADGLLAETRGLQERYGMDAQALGALGYREAAAVLSGSLHEEAAVAAVQQGHRNYAKRQMTWFRREPEVHWLPGFGSSEEIADEASQLVAGALA